MPGLSELSDKFLRYAERSLARAFEFVQGLKEVKDIYDLTKLQTEFIDAQISAMTELIRDLGEIATEPVMRKLKASTSNAAQVTVTLKHLAAAVAERHGMPKKGLEELLKHAVALIMRHLKKGDRIHIAHLGTFQTRNRAARMGRNPATGEPIKIAAGKKVAFRAAKELKEAV